MEDTIDYNSPDFQEAFTAALEGKTQEQAPGAEQQTEQPIVEQSTATVAAIDTPNYAKYFEDLSEGYVKGDEDFKSVVQRAKDYETVKSELEATKSKIPEFKNEETKAIYEAMANGDKDKVFSWLRESQKDYKTMSDLDVQREAIKGKHPNWSDRDVELEIRSEYGNELETIDLTTIDKEENPDEYKEAEAHNKLVEKNLLKLQRDARDSRYELIENQSKIELPKAKQSEPAAQSNQPTEQELAEATAKWVKSVEEAIPQLQNIKQNIDGKEVEYVYSDDDKAQAKKDMATFNIFNFGKKRGWYNEDGSVNAAKLTQDVLQLENAEKINKSYYTQGNTDGKRSTMASIKNFDTPVRGVEEGGAETLEDVIQQAKVKAGW